MSIYIASGWFNDSQLERVMWLEYLLTNKGISFHSPRLEQNTGSREFSLPWRTEIFDLNLSKIDESKLMIAIYDEEDPGTMMEIGYAYANGKPIILLVFNNQPINVMLSEAATMVLNPVQLKMLNFNNIYKQIYTGKVK